MGVLTRPIKITPKVELKNLKTFKPISTRDANSFPFLPSNLFTSHHARKLSPSKIKTF